jgi:hypothetical protein
LIALASDRAIGTDADVATASGQQDDPASRMRRLQQGGGNSADRNRALID